jgi:hypothetical protein
MSAFLTAADVFRLTGRRRFKAQREALDRLGIRYTTSAKGEPLVRPDALDGAKRPARNRARWDRIGL